MKITKEMIADIRVNAVKEAFTARVEAVKSKLAEEAVQVLLSKGQKLGKDIPDDWNEYIIERAHVSVCTEGRWRGFRLDLPISFAQKQTTYEDFNLLKEELKSMKEYEELEAEKEKFKESINKILAIATTDKKLKELSPELYAFLPEQVVDKNLPTSTEDVDFVRAVLGGK